MYLGTAWYPEHWEESRWPIDLDLMRRAGMNVVRIGEYAWSRLEPTEGDYHLDWLERVVNLAEQFGISTVIATPGDAPPSWMSQKYPEILRVAEDGRRDQHGGRRHFSPTNRRYREFCRDMTAKLAQRFAKHPTVLGWQIGNEYCRYTYDDRAHKLFQEWLATRYGQIEILNRRWTTSYWSQEYNDWSQIPLPVGWHNPSLVQAFFHFMSEVYRDLFRVQARAIRDARSNAQWITHNIHGFDELDFGLITQDSDLASWDPYCGDHHVGHAHLGWTVDFCRGLKSRAPWVMETQPGRVSWQAQNLDLHRGEVRDLLWQFYGHGAEAVLFWQWRSPLGGQEQYHGTLLGADGTPRPLYNEIAQVGSELANVKDSIAGTGVEFSVAILYSYADQYAVKKQRHHRDFDPLAHMLAYYKAFRATGIDLDVIQPAQLLSRFRLVLAPHLHCLDEHLTARLIEYVKAGGHLLLGARSGFKDEFNALLPSRQPGTALAQLLGTAVEDFFTLDQPIALEGPLGQGGTASIWAEYLPLDASDLEVPLRYGPFNGWIDHQPAMVSRAVGAGRITYLGTWPDHPTMQRIAEWALSISDVPRFFPQPPEGVEICRRVGNGRKLFVAINHSTSPQQIQLPRQLINLLDGAVSVKSLDLAARQVAVLTNP
jgi:beta-galactosidase